MNEESRMSKNLNLTDDSELEQLIQSIMEEDEGSCIKCGFKMIQQYRTEWVSLTTEIKMRCHQCGHTEVDDTKMLS